MLEYRHITLRGQYKLNNRPTSPLLRALDALIEGRAGSWVINLVVIPVMFLLVLVLPPLSLPQRVLSAGYSGVAPKTGGTLTKSRPLPGHIATK